jgi:hypothetical protein
LEVETPPTARRVWKESDVLNGWEEQEKVEFEAGSAM